MPRMFLADWMHGRASRVPAWRRGGAALSALLLAVGCACGISGCIPTDYFTQVIIDTKAEKVDVDNPSKLVINTPRSDVEDSSLSARVFGKETKQTADKETLVVYSSEPNTGYETQHSLFMPEGNVLQGAESSDPVKLVYSKTAKVDHEVKVDEDEETPKEETKSKTSGGNKESDKEEDEAQEQKDSRADSGTKTSGAKTKKDDANASSGGSNSDDASSGGSNDSGDGDSSGGGSGGGDSASGDGSGNDGSDGNGGGGSGESDDEGNQEDRGGGYDGNVKVYDPGSSRSELNTCDRIAATGQAAVVVQAIGGQGALCAIDAETYNGYSDGRDASWASSFKDVFADELCGLDADGKSDADPAAFERDCLLWAEDGTSSKDVTNINALVAACGKNGVILFDQSVAGYEQRFSDAQLAKIEKAGIQLVPVDMTTVQGVLDAANVVGEVLSESEKCAQDARSMADTYVSTVSSIVKGVADTHGGNLAQGAYPGDQGRKFSSYSGCPVKSYRDFAVQGVFAVDYEDGDGLSYTVEVEDDNVTQSLDVTCGLLFTYSQRCGSTLNSFWMQAAGVVDRTALETDITNLGDASDSLRILATHGYLQSYYLAHFSGYAPSGPFARYSPYWGNTSEHEMGYLPSWMMLRAYQPVMYNSASPGEYTDYFGGEHFPYLVVCPSSSGASAEEVKSKAIKAMKTEDTPIYCLDQRPFKNGLDPEDAVVANPCGLLGSWCQTNLEGSIESVLECAWLGQLYATSQKNGEYDPTKVFGSDGFSDFSAKVGDSNCTTVRDATESFYKTFYRYDIDSRQAKSDGCSYSDIVTDEGVE